MAAFARMAPKKAKKKKERKSPFARHQRTHKTMDTLSATLASRTALAAYLRCRLLDTYMRVRAMAANNGKFCDENKDFSIWLT